MFAGEVLWEKIAIKVQVTSLSTVKVIQVRIISMWRCSYLYWFLIVSETSSAGLTWGIILALMLVGVIIAVTFYYRRKVSNLKTEVQHHVHFTDPHHPDRQNFDNPVYGFQGTDSSHLINNLRPKLNNLDRNVGNGLMHDWDDNSNASSRGKFIS